MNEKELIFYGYCRISTPKQNIERQERNILKVYPQAKILKEQYTGTTTKRPIFENLLKIVRPGETIIFDSVSRMSRNAKDGTELYFKLFDKGINLVFLKEPYINTEIYKSNISDKIKLNGTDIDEILKGVNAYFKKLAIQQINIAFNQSEKEVKDLQERTKEGLLTAKLNGKTLGRPPGTKVITRKARESKEQIIKLSKSFKGNLTDKEIIKLLGLARNTYYNYKRELSENPGELEQ